MNNQHRFGDLTQQRHGAALTIVVNSIGKTVNFGGDQIVKFAQATHFLQLSQTDRQRIRVSF